VFYTNIVRLSTDRLCADVSDPAPPARPRRRGRAPITRAAIVETAMQLLDKDGLDELSMRRVADELDTGAASLYWHVGSKDGLLDLIFDRVIGEIRIPDPEPHRWQEQVKEIARAQRATILAHRDIVRISIGRIPMGPNALQLSERVLAIFRSGGLPDQYAVQGHHLLISVINGFTLDETGGGEAITAEMGQMARDFIAALPADEYPNMVEVADYYAMTVNDQRFELLIEIFVDGLAARAEG
jgi:AcrR family transcriptional regulator